ncbi:hypothetical protein [Nocardia sp. NPDC050435]|uniref:hypothetical protein n=1 Tax=Nocardia sp. NPDC050435 TaxID=3155040 RepID=UPI0033CB268E
MNAAEVEAAWARLLKGALSGNGFTAESGDWMPLEFDCNVPALPMSVAEAHRVTQEHREHPAENCPVKRRALVVLEESGCQVKAGTNYSPRRAPGRRPAH